MSRVLLLGGTGAMGIYLSEILIQGGHEVFVTSRAKRTSKDVIYLHGNAQDELFLRSCVGQVHPDAIVDFMVYSTESFKPRAKFLLNASQHYLFLSSYRVHANSVPLRESSPRLLDVCTDAEYLRTDEYGLTKARQEDILRATATNGQHWSIIRPAITYSKARFQFGVLEANELCWRSFQGRPVIMPTEMLERRTTMTWGRDVAELLARLILNPKAYDEAFILATAESHTWREVFELYHQTIGTILHECTLEEYIRVTDAPWQIRYDRMFNRVIDNTKVLAATGFKQEDFAPLAKALPQELVRFRDRAPILSPSPWRNLTMDALCGLPPTKGVALKDRLRLLHFKHPSLDKLVAFYRRHRG